MPSGSHMTSGGSHFSGGGSSHSSSSSSSHSSSSSSHSSDSSYSSYSDSSGHYHSYHYGYGATFYATFNLKAFLIVILSIAIIPLLVFVGRFSAMMPSFAEKLNKARADYEYYQSMCKRAAENPDYMTTATVYNSYYNEDAGKYYVRYTFSGYYGETFSVYTEEEASAMVGNDHALALNTKNTEINDDTDSILMDYYEMSISRDGEYARVVHSRNVRIFLIVFFLLGTILFVYLIVLVARKNFKPSTKTASVDFTPVTPSTASTTSTNTKWKCRYCGAMNADSSDRCKGCGSRHPNTK